MYDPRHLSLRQCVPVTFRITAFVISRQVFTVLQHINKTNTNSRQVKGKLFPQLMKYNAQQPQGTVKIQLHDFFALYQLELNGQPRVLAALPPAKEPGTHCTENGLTLITEPRAL